MLSQCKEIVAITCKVGLGISHVKPHKTCAQESRGKEQRSISVCSMVKLKLQ